MKFKSLLQEWPKKAHVILTSFAVSHKRQPLLLLFAYWVIFHAFLSSAGFFQN